MINKKIRKILCVTAMTMCLFSSTTALASTIEFNVTVGGSGTQDPTSKREQKASDNDNNAYYRGSVFSSNNKINVRSIHLYDNNIYTTKAASLTPSNIGITYKRAYNVTAPGGDYYYMKAVPKGARVNVKGFYCP